MIGPAGVPWSGFHTLALDHLMQAILFWCLLFFCSICLCTRKKRKIGGNSTGKDSAKAKKATVTHRSSAQCKNHYGEDVDWWFILEESGPTKRYLYFDSKMAHISDLTGLPPKFMPLDNRYVLDDPATSPLLKTLYMSRPRENLKNVHDNTIMIAVNDQRGAEGDNLDEIEKQLKKIAKRSKDPNADYIRIDKGKDIFGDSITSNNAHAKYIFTSQVVPTEDEKKVKVRSYLISHSLPRFPNFTTRDDGTMVLPVIQRNIFNKNALTALSKGQHFFCQSFENEENLDSDSELEYEPSKVQSYVKSDRHLVSIYHLFKTINAAVVFSNYYNQMAEPGMKVYHKLFDPRSSWSPKREFTSLIEKAIRLYPIGPVQRSLRTVNCRKCDIKLSCPVQCISSYPLSTVDNQYGLKFNTVAHAGQAKLDIYDDIIAPQVIPKAFYTTAPSAAGIKYLMDTLIVQSWMDHTTLANNMRELVRKEDGLGVQAKVWITNSLSLRYPIHLDSQKDDEAYLRQQSFGSNHAKLAFSVPLHGVGERTALFCFADKNRTLTQRGRVEDTAGRGGAAWCTYSGILSALMLTLHPEVVDNQVQANMPISRILPYLFDSDPERITVLQYDKDKTRVDIGFPSRSHKFAYHVAAMRHPFVNMVENGRMFHPVGTLYSYQVHDSDASSESESEGESSEHDDEESVGTVDTDQIMPAVYKTETQPSPLKRNRSRSGSDHNRNPKKMAIASFGSPLKQDGTPIKFKRPLQANIHNNNPGLSSPEHYRPVSELQFSNPILSEELELLLAERISADNIKKIYEALKANPPSYAPARRKIF